MAFIDFARGVRLKTVAAVAWLAVSFGQRLGSKSHPRTSAGLFSLSARSLWTLGTAVVLSVFLNMGFAAAAQALPTCNVNITVQQNSSNNLYILTAPDLANCDPGFSGISPGVQSSTNGVSGLGAFYSPNHGGSHRFETTVNDDRVTYTPAAGFSGVETVGACGEPGTTNCGTITFTVLAVAPTVTAVSPTSGPTGGGTTVTLTGTNFTGVTAVTFGATAATGFTFNSATSITATAPAGTGTVDIRVTTPGGTSATSAADQYTYIPAPTVTSISPTSGPTTGGTVVTITGTNFSGATAVNFGGSSATGITVFSATSITATAPAGTGTVDVRVTTGGGTSATSAADQYTYIAAPTVTSILPTSGPTTGGTVVTITGTNFSGATAVNFGATSASGITVFSATSITATAPAGTGTVNVRVTTGGGTSATGAANQYTYIAAPTVTSISPTSGPTSGGGSVTITGTNFSGATALTFGATSASGITVINATTITATAPAGTGTVDVRVTTGGGTSATSAADQYTYIAAPTVTSISPTSGPTTGGTTVTITGSNLSGSTAVTFGATPATGFTVNSATSITATAPAGTGTIDIRVTTAGGTSSTTAADQYTYIAAPTVTSISPTAGPTGGGTTVTITGSNLSGSTAVTFGATPATGFTVNSATSITATAPAGTGTIDIRVTTAGGTSSTTAADQYTYIAAPTVTSISPTAGPTGGGTTVTITGSNLSGSTAVTFGATPAAGFTVNSATSITATAPAGTGTIDIRVTTTGGTSATSGADQYTYIAAPTVTSISPTAGPATGGTTVTLTGTSFNGVTAVTFGATPATGFTFNSATSITATAPAGTGTVDIRVTTAGGTSSTTAADQYTYIAAPTVTSISPTAGPTSGGTTVTLTGTNFVGVTAVTFGATPAAGFTFNSATSITATAPAGTGTVDVRITTTGGTSATSAADQYTYIAAPTVTSISPTSGPTAGGTTVTITGANLSGAAAVTFGATPATGFTVNSATSITATAPAGTATIDIRVTTTGGTSATTAADQYTWVAAPTATNVSGLAVTFNTATPIDLSGSITGGHSSIAVSTAPTHGTTSIAGDVITYTPAANYAGADSFAYTATGVGGTSAPATVSLTVSQGSQTITFNALSDASLSASPLTLSATASSGLTVSFTSTTTSVCTVSGTTLTLLQTGTCSIDADQAGDATWTAAPTASRSFAVNPANLVITTNAPSGTAVGASYSQTNTGSGGVAPYTYALNAGAFPPGTTLDATTGQVSGAPTTAGTFNYRLQVTDSQGTPVTTTGSIVSATIAKGTQTLSFTSTAPASATVGGASYTVAATASSGLAASVSLDGTGTGCALAGGTVTFTSPGTCRINANQAGDTNWNAAAQVQQSFTVGAASAIGASIDFSPTPLAVGANGVMTLTFTNANASASPPLNGLLTADASVVSRIAGAPGGTCTVGSASVPTTATVQLSNVVVPSGGCTVTFGYRGSAAGAGAGFTLSAFTPSGYPTTSMTMGNSFVVRPTVTSITPASGPVSQVVTISGTGFSTTPGNNTVAFAAAGAGTVTAASATSLTVTAPAAGSGAVNVTVTVNGQISATGPTYTFIDPPVAAARPGVAVAYNSAGTAIDLTASITGGPHASIAIGSAPTHGTTSIAGDVVTYTPAAGYFGADSFTWTATGPGGTSAPATVSLTVATPVVPTVADVSGVAVAYNGAGTAIDLSASVTGVHANLAVASAPAHGTTSVAGDVVTYTPASGYFGADSFTWTATGPGGTSAPATVSLTVATPPAPTATDRGGVAVAYNSTGTAIDLSGSVTGVHSSLAVGTAPAHGTVSVAGDVVTYTPANTYFGADSFTWTATGPGGTSAPATVTLSVAAPPPPVVTPPPPVTAPPPQTGGTGEVTVNLGAQTTGVIDGFRVTVAAQHGSATVEAGATASAASAGSHSASPSATVQYSLVYVPAPGFMGTDTVTVVAFGPGGDSTPATFTFRIPGKAPDLSGQTPSSGSVTFTPTTGLTGGPFQALRITRAPNFGTAVVQGLSIVFTPGVANGGPTSLDYVIDLPFGSSAPGRIALTSNLVPVAQALTASTVQGRPVTVRISDVQGGPFTGATVVSISPTTAGAATVARAGTAWDLTFTPAGTFSGQAVVTYTLTNAFGTATSTVAVTVEARPDPSLDPDVRGVASGQVTTARRFADAQISNVQRRLQDLHDGDNGSSNGLSLNLGFGGQADGDNDPREALRRQLGQGRQDDPGALGDDRSREMLGLDVWAGRQAAPDAVDPTLGHMAPTSGRTTDAPRSAVGVWSAGSVDWGRQDADGRRDDRFTTQGVTAGLDVRVSDQLIVGGGLGYGEDKTRIGDEGTTTTGEGITGALYASWRPAEAIYLDGMLGYADLDFASRRWTQGLAGQADGYATGERSGDVRFASAAFGRIARSPMRTSDLYARLDAREITLDGFVETGAGLASLAWDAVEQKSLSASLGASWRWTMDARSHGVFTPSLRVEWSHELEDLDDQGVRYADWAASPTYLVPLDAWSRDSLRLDLGADWAVTERLMLSLGYRGMIGDASESHGAEVRIKIGW